MNFRAQATFRAGDFSRVEAKLVPRIKQAVTQGTLAVFEESQILVPVDTGELKDSGETAVEWVEQKVTGYVQYTAEHAAYNEFGTGQRGAASGNAAPGIKYNPDWPGMIGTPYIRPALDMKRPEIKAAFIDAGFTI